MKTNTENIKSVLVVGKNFDEFNQLRDDHGIKAKTRGIGFTSGGVYFKFVTSGANLKGANPNNVAVLFVGDKVSGKKKYDREGSVCPVTSITALVKRGVLKKGKK